MAGFLAFAIPIGCIVFVLGFMVWAIIRQRRKLREYEQSVHANPAFTEALDLAKLRADPAGWRNRLQGKISTVNAVSETVMTTGGQAGGTVSTHYNSFVIDANGEIHDIERSADADAVATHAQWLAELFEVPFANETLGRPRRS